MILKEHFEIAGNWLFRWRSYFPLLFLPIIFLSFVGSIHQGTLTHSFSCWQLFCLLISLLGLVIRSITIGCVPKNTSGRNTRGQLADELNTTGLYSLVRNPLYLGNFFMTLGIIMLPRQWNLVMLYGLCFSLYYERIIFAEELFLLDKFGDEYLDWANRTPAFFPKFKGYKKSGISFSFKNVLKREYHGILAVMLVMALFSVVQNWQISQTIYLDAIWQWLLFLAFMIWLVLRCLKKYATFLNVEGR